MKQWNKVKSLPVKRSETYLCYIRYVSDYRFPNQYVHMYDILYFDKYGEFCTKSQGDEVLYWKQITPPEGCS